MNNWHYVFGHTKDEYYTKHADELEKTLIENGMKPYVRAVIPDSGGWVSTCMQMPRFMYEQLKASDEDIVFLDADARVRKYPALFDTIEEDIAFHTKDGREPLCGTMYFKNNERVYRFFERWLEMQKAIYPHRLAAQVAMGAVAKEGIVSIYNLPPQYTQIFDLMAKHGSPVIEHMQASRKAPNKNGDRDWKKR